tara:strand:+ start:358 stop:726 length:369 start_codon:yes stop_codon:yes gene_type:complete
MSSEISDELIPNTAYGIVVPSETFDVIREINTPVPSSIDDLLAVRLYVGSPGNDELGEGLGLGVPLGVPLGVTDGVTLGLTAGVLLGVGLGAAAVDESRITTLTVVPIPSSVKTIVSLPSVI